MPPTLPAATNHRIGLGLRHEAFDLVGLPQIEIARRGEYNVAMLALEPPHDGGTDHAGMTGDKDALAAQFENDRRRSCVSPSVVLISHA